MSEYLKTTNFTAKDSLPAGDVNKKIVGAQFDTEFNNISTAIASKADLSSPALVGVPTAPTATAGNNTTQVATTAFVTTAVANERTATATLTNKTITGSLTGNVTGNVTGNADTATTLATARTIGGVSFDGSANIDLPGVNAEGSQNTTGNAATATSATKISGFTWTVEEVGFTLYFKMNGVTKATLDNSGNLTVAGNVTAFGSF